MLQRGGLPPDLHVGDPEPWSAPFLPQGELTAINGNPTQPGAGALPGHEQPPPPRTCGRRHPAHEAAPSVTRWARPLAMVGRTWGRRNGPEPRRSPEAWATQVAGAPGSAGRPYRGGATPAAGAPDKADADACPSRSKAMGSIHDCERSRRTRHVSRNPLGFVTPSPTGRPSNRSSRRFSPSPFGRIPRETKSPASAVLRSAPADASRRCSAGFRTGSLASPRGTR